MEKKEKFLVELEIEVEYNIPDDIDMATVPYTVLETSIDNDKNIVSLKTKQGKITGFNNVKFKRK